MAFRSGSLALLLCALSWGCQGEDYKVGEYSFSYDANAYGVGTTDGVTRGGATAKLITAVPDTYFIWQNETAMILSGQYIGVEQFIFKRDLDLQIAATIVTLPVDGIYLSTKEYNRTAYNRAEEVSLSTGDLPLRTVFIHAQYIYIPANGCVIDVSGRKGQDAGLGVAAKMGAPDQGANGTDGVSGEDGWAGGIVVLEAGQFVGGNITIRANGGFGGKGQDGGHGGRGRQGDPNSDTEACCYGRPTDGNPGGPAGNGGSGGNGGKGGAAGFVRVLYTAGWADSGVPVSSPTDFDIQATKGEGGPPGISGLGGPAGRGGPGSGTKCVTFGWFGLGKRDKRCFLPLGPTGADSAPGLGGADGVAGEAGEVSSDFGVTDVREVDLQTMQADACIYGGMTFDMYSAARLYKTQQWSWATHLYQWVKAVADANSTTCQAAQANGWKIQTQQAAVYLNQLSIGLDFWGNGFDHTPLLTYDEILGNTQNLITIAQQAELAFDEYSTRFLDYDERDNIVQEGLKNAEFMITAKKDTLSKTLKQIQETKAEIKELELQRTALDIKLSKSGEECDAQIRRKTADEHYAWGPTFNRLVSFISRTVTVGLAFYTSFGLAAAAVGSIFKASTALLETFSNDAQSAAQNPTFSGVEHLLISGAVPVVSTLVTNTQSVSSLGQTTVTDLQTTLTEIDGMFKEGSTLMDASIRNVRAERHQQAIMDWLAPLPACVVHFPDIDLSATLAAQHDALVAAHDEDVIKYATTQMEILELEHKRVAIANEAAGAFDPTSLNIATMIGVTYVQLKDDIIRALADLNGALNYQFCASKEFTYQSNRVVQLQSAFAELQAQFTRLVESDSMSRTEVADYPDFESADGQPAATTIFTISNNVDTAAAFEQFYTGGTLNFNIARDDAALPIGAANMRVMSAQAYSPQLNPTATIAEIHTKRLGVSECRGAEGLTRTFAHAPRTYYTMYRHAEGAGKWLTGKPEVSARHAPTPVGAWEIGMPQLETEAERRTITSVELHLVISFVPCLTGDCSPQQ